MRNIHEKRADPREAMRGLQQMADRVCVLILSSDLPAIDIEIEKNKVRERCLELFPDREELYEMIYESRFQRLWEQFGALVAFGVGAALAVLAGLMLLGISGEGAGMESGLHPQRL
jgi:hypothetical protein